MPGPHNAENIKIAVEKIINQSDLNDLSPTCAYMNHENEHRFVQPKNKLFLPFSLHTF